MMVGYPNRFFGGEHPSGHDGISYDSPAFLPFNVMMGNMDDRKLLLQ